MVSVAINSSHACQARERRAERHRIRKLLLRPTGVKQWIHEANDTLNLLMAGMPDEVLASVKVEVGQLGSEIQTMVQAALDRRDLPSDLAAQIYFVVCERLRVEHDAQPHCSHCGHASAQHSTVVDAWCYECRGECRYTQSSAEAKPAERELDEATAASATQRAACLRGFAIVRAAFEAWRDGDKGVPADDPDVFLALQATHLGFQGLARALEKK